MSEHEAAISEALAAMAHRESPDSALSEALDQDPALRDAMVEQLAIDRLLRTRHEPPSCDLVASVMGRIETIGRTADGAADQSETTPRAHTARRRARRPRASRRAVRLWPAALAAAAALIVLGVLAQGLWSHRAKRPEQARTPGSQPAPAEPTRPVVPERPERPSPRPPEEPARVERLAAFAREVDAAVLLLRRGRHDDAARHLAAARALDETAELATLIEINALLADRPTEHLEALIALCDRLRVTESPKLAACGQALHERWVGERANQVLARQGDEAMARSAWREARRWYAQIGRDSAFRAAGQAGDRRCRAEIAEALGAEADRLLAARRHADAVDRYREAIAIAPPELQGALTARRERAQQQLAAARKPPGEADPVRTGHRLLVIGCEGSDASTVAAALRAIAGASVAVELHLCGGRLLMESYHHPAHKAGTLAALRKAAGYSHVLIVDGARASSFPEYHFEGVYQIQRKLRALAARPLLLQLSGDPARTAELAYRVGHGTGATVVPVGAVAQAHRAASRSDCAAAATLAALDGGASKLRHPLVAKANAVFARQQKIRHFTGSYSAKGRVHVLPLPLPRARDRRVIMTGTSSERVWQNALQSMRGPRVTHLGNDDDGRRFGATDLARARPIFARAPDQFIIAFARAFSIDAKQVRGANQRFLQCQVYCKVEPLTATMSLEEVARRVFHPFEVISKYEQARKHDLSFIPWHVALARIHDQRPGLVLSTNHVKPTRPFFEMLAAMSWTSRTGGALEQIPRSSASLVNVGTEVIGQLAHLTVSGKPGIQLDLSRFVHCGELAVRLQGRVEVPADFIRAVESQRAARGVPAAQRKELDVLYRAVQQAIAEQRARIDRVRASDPSRMAVELGRLAETHAGTRIGARIARDLQALTRSSRFRSEKTLHASWLEAQRWIDARAARPGPERVALAKQAAPALRALCKRYQMLPLVETILAWLADEGA